MACADVLMVDQGAIEEGDSAGSKVALQDGDGAELVVGEEEEEGMIIGQRKGAEFDGVSLSAAGGGLPAEEDGEGAGGEVVLQDRQMAALGPRRAPRRRHHVLPLPSIPRHHPDRVPPVLAGLRAFLDHRPRPPMLKPPIRHVVQIHPRCVFRHHIEPPSVRANHRMSRPIIGPDTLDLAEKLERFLVRIQLVHPYRIASKVRNKHLVQGGHLDGMASVPLYARARIPHKKTTRTCQLKGRKMTG